jgi:hypothetical protein
MTRRVDGSAAETADLDLERSASTRVSFAPGTTTTYEFTLSEKGTPTEQRPDIGIGADDVRITGRTVRVKVHSLGAVDAPAGIASIEDDAGKVLASAPIAAMEAPRDLMPRTTEIVLKLRARLSAGARVRVRFADAVPEVTQLNNMVVLPR